MRQRHSDEPMSQIFASSIFSHVYCEYSSGFITPVLAVFFIIVLSIKICDLYGTRLVALLVSFAICHTDTISKTNIPYRCGLRTTPLLSNTVYHVHLITKRESNLYTHSHRATSFSVRFMFVLNPRLRYVTCFVPVLCTFNRPLPPGNLIRT